MKKTLLFISLGFFAISCSSDDDGFDGANGNVEKKYITKMVSTANGETNTSTVIYGNEGQVISASDGESNKGFVYDSNGKLTRISGGGDFLMSEVFNTIHEVYEIGDVLQYDSKGNPTIIELYEDDYWTGERVVSKATITYDDKPFAFYYTLDAAGIIEVLNNTRLNFVGLNATPSELTMAKRLLPVNNPYKAVVENENTQEVLLIDVSYNYGSDKYPTSATVIVNSNGDVESYSTTYEYK